MLLSLFSVGLFGQTNIETQSSYSFPKIKSNIILPITIPILEISNIINGSVKDLIFQDDSFTDNDNDQFKVKVWKTKSIRLVGDSNGNIFTEVPLKIWAQKGIGTLGIYSYQETTFETIMYFKSGITLNNNWTVSTFTQPMGFKWVKKPVLDFGKIEIPITALVENSLKDQQYKFSKTIDDQIATQLNFQQYAVLAWNSFSQAFSISEEYATWLKVTPISVNVTPLKIYGNQINTNIGIDLFSETITGSKPNSSPLTKSVMNFNFVPSLANEFLLQTTANIPFSEATAIARKSFLNKEFDLNNSKVKITDIKVYDESEKIMIEADLEGYVKGKAFISGIPIYDEIQQKIVLSNTKFKLKTMNILQKTASVLFKSKIVKTIETEYGIPTNDLENISKKSVEEAFNKEYYKGLKMSGKVLKLKPNQILLNASGITAVIDISANLNLTLKDF
ncbi:MAG: DUF4403 family protein [Chryseobacterium sp.]|nr:DUF4403 family protein [Candidatus Chryseobacterium enterohippi]